MSRPWGLPALRPAAVATPGALVERRALIAGAPTAPPAPGVTVARVEVGGVPCVRCTPSEGAEGVLLHLHGGGYRLANAHLFAPFASRLAAATGRTVLTVDYRVAPEHPFPAALHDAVAAYDALLDEHERPALVGDSAGGGLAAALTIAALRAGAPAPAALVLLSPWLDLGCDAASYASRAATDALFSPEAAREAAALYLQGHDPADPLASPGRAEVADLAGFPPVLLFASTGEVLLDDTTGFATRLATAGVPVTAVVERGRDHAWPSVHPDRPESSDALQAMARFLARLPSRRPHPLHEEADPGAP